MNTILAKHVLELLRIEEALAAFALRKRGGSVADGFTEEEMSRLQRLCAPSEPAQEEQRVEQLLAALRSSSRSALRRLLFRLRMTGLAERRQDRRPKG